MSSCNRILLSTFLASLLSVLVPGCATTPPPGEEEEDISARVMRTEMLEHRARLEPRTGLVIPTNNRFDVADPTDGVAGLKGQFEAVQKGMWFGLEFDFSNLDSKDPVVLGTPQPALLVARTEQLMRSMDRYQVLMTWDYDIPLGDDPYIPIFRFGIGLGAMGVHPNKAEGNTLLNFDNYYTFVGRPTIGFRFPFHENVGAFVDASYDFVPKAQFSGENRVSNQSVDIGDKVELSAINILAGISFEW